MSTKYKYDGKLFHYDSIIPARFNHGGNLLAGQDDDHDGAVCWPGLCDDNNDNDDDGAGDNDNDDFDKEIMGLRDPQLRLPLGLRDPLLEAFTMISTVLLWYGILYCIYVMLCKALL